MKNLSFITAFILFTFIGSTINAQTRDVGNFSAVKVSTSISAKLVKSDENKIEYKMIKGSDKSLITEVKGKTLIVKIKSKSFGFNNNSKAKVIIYYTDINDISASAGASIISEGTISANSMDIDLSSGASANLEIETRDLDAEASSGSSLNLKGSTTQGEFDASSGASISAKRLICDHADADASSGASITIHANKSIKADASSGGSIRYAGDAEDSHIDSGWSGQIKRI